MSWSDIPNVLRTFLKEHAMALAILGVGFLAVRLYIHRWLALVGAPTPQNITPLPSQQIDISRIMTRINMANDVSSPQIALQGKWGDGKTVILKALWQELESRGPFFPRLRFCIGRPKEAFNVVVYVNAWQYANEENLHFGLLERLCGAMVRRKLGHFVPSRFVFYFFRREFVRMLGGTLSKLSMVSIANGIPPNAWHGLLVRLQHLLHKKNVQVVWIIEDLDRTTPELAQLMATVTRRTLDTPGSVRIMSFVNKQLDFKVFTPFVPLRDDLEYSMLAILYDKYQQGSQGNATPLGGLITTNDSGESNSEKVEISSSAALAFQKVQQKCCGEDPVAKIHDHVRVELVRWFATCGDRRRRQIQDELKDKYVGDTAIPVTQLQPDDWIQLFQVGEMKGPFDELEQGLNLDSSSVTIVQQKANGLIRNELLRKQLPAIRKTQQRFRLSIYFLIEATQRWLASRNPASQSARRQLYFFVLISSIRSV